MGRHDHPCVDSRSYIAGIGASSEEGLEDEELAPEFTGEIDEVMFFGRALAPAEIRAGFETTFGLCKLPAGCSPGSAPQNARTGSAAARFRFGDRRLGVEPARQAPAPPGPAKPAKPRPALSEPGPDHPWRRHVQASLRGASRRDLRRERIRPAK